MIDTFCLPPKAISDPAGAIGGGYPAYTNSTAPFDPAAYTNSTAPFDPTVYTNSTTPFDPAVYTNSTAPFDLAAYTNSTAPLTPAKPMTLLESIMN